MKWCMNEMSVQHKTYAGKLLYQSPWGIGFKTEYPVLSFSRNIDYQPKL